MMNKVILYSLLSIVSFSVSAESKKINMSRIEAELSIAEQRLSGSQKRNQEAYSELEKVDLYKKFKKELEECESARNCEKNPDFLAADEALINSDAYGSFRPIYHEFIYDQLRQHGLEKMVKYVRHNVSHKGDIESMRMGAHSALHVDTWRRLTEETAPIRDKVYQELLDLIELEDSRSDEDSL